jgi:phosphotransferase system enzyme I (PtsI)
MEKRFEGIGVSPGIAAAKALVLGHQKTEVPYYSISAAQVKAEKERFHRAIGKSRAQLLELKEKIKEKVGKEHAYIFDAHIYMLEDGMLLNKTEELISGRKINAEWAVEQVINDLSAIFSEFTDNYFKERMSDIMDVGGRVQKNLLGNKMRKAESIPDEVILVAHNLLPSDTAVLDWEQIKGLVTDTGGQTTHSGIIARSLAKPAVVAKQNFSTIVKNGDTVIVDGNKGMVILKPGKKQLAKYRRLIEKTTSPAVVFSQIRDKPARTLDGLTIKIKANLETIREIDAAVQSGAAGIGLFRSEYIYFETRGELPSIQEQVRIYREAASKMKPHDVTIRTYDLGADKAFCSIDGGTELNPAMGLRGIRFCLREESLFRDQLEAILRANSHGNLKILLPLITGLEELRHCKDVIRRVRKSLEKKSVKVKTDIPVGVMIEVPAAVTVADLLAREADFFSIGTNDLIQYALGIDRYNENVSYLYQPLHPAVLRMAKHVVDAGHREGIPVGMCGEMAADPIFIPILLGLGLDELSMNPNSIPLVKQFIRGFKASQAREIFERSLDFGTAEEIESYLMDKIKALFPTGFVNAVDK